MMRRFHRTLYALELANGVVHCRDGGTFDRTAYSRFKYGYLPPAIEYGRGLASLIADELREVSAGQPVYVVSAPYKFLPTASHGIAKVLCAELGHRAVADSYEPPVLVPFLKARPSTSSYATRTQAERLESLKTLGLHLDESLVPSGHWLVVDDIRVTGSAERATAAYLEPLGPVSVWYLHAAALPGDVDPQMEHWLNQTIPHTLDDILRDVLTGSFQLNTRVLRHILESGDPNGEDPMGQTAVEFIDFLSELPAELLREIHEAAVGSGVNYYRKHEHNLNIVWNALRSRDVLPMPVVQ